jgi:hypothetical protein
MLGHILRDIRSMMLDKFRQPKMILAATDGLFPIATDRGVLAANHCRSPAVVIPLHKGSDSFMSSKGFQTYYWPR